MMSGENIICFARDWAQYPTSNHHVMRLLARNNRVLWLNSIATRSPALSSSRDLKKIGRKIASSRTGLKRVDEQLWVYTPMVLPLPHSKLAMLANRQILRRSVGRLRRELGIHDFQLWSFIPSAAPYVGHLGESLTVYYCVDEWSQFSALDTRGVDELDRQLCQKADIVFTTSQGLLDRKRGWNPETHLASHGVDHAHFASALLETTPVAQELAGASPPVLGFFGLLEDWIDLDLLVHVAERRPEWTIALIGKAAVDLARLERYPNVKVLGSKPYQELPRYCRAFSLALVPFVRNELTSNFNPLKLREYLSAGLPVVSTDIPEVRLYPEWCHIGNTPEEFLAACETALRLDSPIQRARRSQAMQNETWEEKLKEIVQRVQQVKARKRSP